MSFPQDFGDGEASVGFAMSVNVAVIYYSYRCTVSLHSEPQELPELAARHAVDVHGHIDRPERREHCSRR